MRPTEGIFLRVHPGGYIALSSELYEFLGFPRYVGLESSGPESLTLWRTAWDSEGALSVNRGKKLKNGKASIRQVHTRRLRNMPTGRYEAVEIEGLDSDNFITFQKKQKKEETCL